MATDKRKQYLYICTSCKQERWSTAPGNPSGMCAQCAPGQGLSPIERFWLRVNKDIACSCHSWEDRCWQWTGSCNIKTGYGQFWIEKTNALAHRFIYQHEYGPLPKDIQVLHSPPCILRHCVRHLYAGTAKQNTQDIITMQRFPTGEAHAKVRKGYVNFPRGAEHAARHKNYVNTARGEKNGNAIFTAETVLAIRAAEAAGTPIPIIMEQFGKSRTTIMDIVKKRTWKHLD